jgi:Putative MetA-pathway of phenol degradation
VKYRLAAANEAHGNYILTAFLQVTFPTGQYKNGSTNTIVTPTIAYGKGIGSFDVQGTFGVTLPTGNEAQIGRTLPWNNAFQYHLYKKLWPEVEVNYTRFMDGPNDGKPRPSSRREFVLAGFTCTSAQLLQQEAGSKSLQLIFIPTTTTEF